MGINGIKKIIYYWLWVSSAVVIIVACNVEENPSGTKNGTDILSFYLSDGVNDYHSFSISDSTIYVSVANHADLSSLKAIFTHNGNIVSVNGISQISGESENDFSDFSKPLRYHIESVDGRFRDYTILLFDIPVVSITTEGKSPILNKEDWIPANIKIIDTNGTILLDKKVSIKGRGNASWTGSYPKKSYSLKFDDKTSLFGYPKSKRWVMLGTSGDWTKLRTPLCFEISELLGTEWTPKGQNVEFILNDSLYCNYYLCEQIRVEKNRIDIQEMTPADTLGEALTGGVLFEVDGHFDEEYKFRSKYYRLPFMLRNPDKDVHEKQFEYFVSLITQIEESFLTDEALATNSFNDLIDIDSYIRWWLVNEISLNYEGIGIQNNFYMYKDRGFNSKLYAGPIWDIDWGTFCDDHFEERGVVKDGEIWICKNRTWFSRLFQSSLFVNRVKEVWNNNYSKLNNIDSFFYEIKNYNANSVHRDQSLFPLEYLPDNINANTDNGLEYEKANEKVLYVLKSRIEWLNKKINEW